MTNIREDIDLSRISYSKDLASDPQWQEIRWTYLFKGHENVGECHGANIIITPGSNRIINKLFMFLGVFLLMSIITFLFTEACMAMAMPARNYDTKPLGKDMFSKMILRCKTPAMRPFDKTCAEEIFNYETSDLNKNEISDYFSKYGGKCIQSKENINIINCNIYVYLKVIESYVFAPDKEVGFDAFDLFHTIHFDKNSVSSVNISAKYRDKIIEIKGQETKIGEDYGKR